MYWVYPSIPHLPDFTEQVTKKPAFKEKPPPICTNSKVTAMTDAPTGVSLQKTKSAAIKAYDLSNYRFQHSMLDIKQAHCEIHQYAAALPVCKNHTEKCLILRKNQSDSQSSKKTKKQLYTNNRVKQQYKLKGTSNFAFQHFQGIF